MLKIYNTLTRKKDVFKPIKGGEVGMYTCGPTVYWYPHIGNMRAYLFADTLKRVLLYGGYKVKQIMNITDVGHLTSGADSGDDRMEKAALKEGKSAKEIADFYFNAFCADLEKLNISKPDKWTKATEHIKEQIELIKKLEEKGNTYKTSDGIYFDSLKFKNYAKLAKLDIKGLKAGKRIAIGDKKNKTDFALWKFSSGEEKRQQEWKSPWGIGFPGWHIECSAMSMKYLGEHFDIHTGGIDHVPIHHTNEIAQSESATGKKFVNYWVHNDFLMFKGEKVSKSKGGLYTISELQELGYQPMHYRYLFLLTQYNKPLNFSIENLDSAKNAYEKLKRKIIELKKESHKGIDKTKEYIDEFEKAINDDLNMPLTIQILWKVIDDFDFDSQKKIKMIEKFDSVFGLRMDEMQDVIVIASKELEHLMNEREKLRKEKKWVEADILRGRIKEKGYNVIDTDEGQKLEKV